MRRTRKRAAQPGDPYGRSPTSFHPHGLRRRSRRPCASQGWRCLWKRRGTSLTCTKLPPLATSSSPAFSPVGPPPSSHWTPFEQASLEPHPLANGRRWLLRPSGAGRGWHTLRASPRSPWGCRRRFFGSPGASVRKDATSPGRLEKLCKHRGGARLALEARSAKACLLPYPQWCLRTHFVLGSFSAPAQLGKVRKRDPQTTFKASVPSHCEMLPRNSSPSRIGREGHLTETFIRAWAGTESRGPNGRLWGGPVCSEALKWVQLSCSHDNVSF